MARARKLFPIYGSALANTMLATLERERVVAGLVATYVSDYGRREILGGPLRDRELADTIGREIVIAMIHEVRQILPRFFPKTRRAQDISQQKDAMEAFFNELTGTLERAWRWDAEDRRQFRRDLALYTDFAARQSKISKPGKSKRASLDEPPFIGRVAILLDPSMLEQARRAARKFYSAAGKLAQKLLAKTLRQSR